MQIGRALAKSKPDARADLGCERIEISDSRRSLPCFRRQSRRCDAHYPLARLRAHHSGLFVRQVDIPQFAWTFFEISPDRVAWMSLHNSLKWLSFVGKTHG